jgi:hypothetical protein
MSAKIAASDHGSNAAAMRRRLAMIKRAITMAVIGHPERGFCS